MSKPTVQLEAKVEHLASKEAGPLEIALVSYDMGAAAAFACMFMILNRQSQHFRSIHEEYAELGRIPKDQVEDAFPEQIEAFTTSRAAFAASTTLAKASHLATHALAMVQGGYTLAEVEDAVSKTEM
jgi:hypothetical protein